MAREVCTGAEPHRRVDDRWDASNRPSELDLFKETTEYLRPFRGRG
jgi:hypothetical protein